MEDTIIAQKEAPPTSEELRSLSVVLPRIDLEPIGVWDPSIPAKIYHADRSALSQGSARKALQTAAHWYVDWTAPYIDKETPALRVGHLLHTCVLEPAKWLPVIEPTFEKVDRRTTDGKKRGAEIDAELAAWRLALPNGAILTTDDEKSHIEAMAMEIMSSRDARALLEEVAAMREVVGYHTHPATGIRCRSMLDLLAPELIVDIKTTMDARKEAFRKSIWDYGYHFQAASYTEAEMCISKRDTRALFAWIVVEKEGHHGVKVYTADDEMMSVGIAERELALSRIAAGIKSGKFETYPTGVESISLPPWAVRS